MTILEELMEMQRRLAILGDRIEHEPELVTLDRCSTYKVAADAIQNAGMELNRRVHRRHQSLLGETYNGKTVDQAIVERMTLAGFASNVPCIQQWPDAATLQAIDSTP